jgi:YidC/Oxa1 family membrane protein insertase
MVAAFEALLNFLGSALAYFYQVIPNYGVAIVLLTVAVRVVLLPLTIKQTRSMQEMQRLQPELKRLQAKYKGGDKQKLNEEMMKLYKEHHVNPLGGCLPMLLQLPILWAFYRVLEACGQTVKGSKACLPAYVGVGHIPKTSALYRAIVAGHHWFLGINLGLSPVAVLHQGILKALPAFVLVVLMVATTWYQQQQIMAVSTGQQAQQMQMMGKIMPLLLGVFSLELVAGISVYWVASNLWTVGQQSVILKKPAGGAEASGPPEPAKSGGAGGKSSSGGKAAPAVAAGNGKLRARGGAKPGAKEPQRAGTNRAGAPKPAAKAGTGGDAGAGAGAGACAGHGSGRKGPPGAKGGQGAGKNAPSGRGGQDKAAGKARPPVPAAVEVPAAALAEAGEADEMVTAGDGAEHAEAGEAPVDGSGWGNGQPGGPGSGSNGAGKAPAGAAPRARPQRAQPGAAGPARKRRRK